MPLFWLIGLIVGAIVVKKELLDKPQAFTPAPGPITGGVLPAPAPAPAPKPAYPVYQQPFAPDTGIGPGTGTVVPQGLFDDCPAGTLFQPMAGGSPHCHPAKPCPPGQAAQCPNNSCPSTPTGKKILQCSATSFPIIDPAYGTLTPRETCEQTNNARREMDNMLTARNFPTKPGYLQDCSKVSDVCPPGTGKSSDGKYCLRLTPQVAPGGLSCPQKYPSASSMPPACRRVAPVTRSTMKGLGVPANPTPRAVTQPNGMKFMSRLNGDEWCHWTTNAENNWPVVQRADGYWVYARVDAGGRHAETNQIVGAVCPTVGG